MFANKALFVTFHLIAGALLCAAFAPISWYPIAPILVAVMMWQWTRLSRRRAVWGGYLFGLAYFFGSTYWIYYSAHDYGGAHWAAAILITVLMSVALAFYMAALAFGVWRTRDAPSWLRVLAWPSLWFAVEWLRGSLLSSFAWNSLSQSLIESPLFGVFPLFGVYGAGWLMVFVGALLVEAARRCDARFAAGAVAVAVGVTAAAWASSSFEWTRVAGAPVRVAVLQGGMSQAERFNRESTLAMMREYAEMTREAPKNTLVVWPEVAIPIPYRLLRKYIGDLVTELAARNSALVAGVWVREDDERSYNSLVFDDGETRTFYHKRHLVPFGEYMPLRFLLAWVKNFVTIPMSDLSAGALPPVMTIGEHEVGVSICYEATLSERIADALPRANYLLNVSNDGWFGDSFAPWQHLNMARLRAAEFARPMVRATTTGISAIINYQGAVLWRSKQFSQYGQVETIQPRRGATPYAVWGNAPIMVVSALSFIIWMARRQRKRHRDAKISQ